MRACFSSSSWDGRCLWGLSWPAGFFSVERASELCVLACLAQLSVPPRPGCLLSHTLICLPGVFCLRPIWVCVQCPPPPPALHNPLPQAVSWPQTPLSGGGYIAGVRAARAYWPGLLGFVLIFLHPLGWSPFLWGDTAPHEGALGMRQLFPSRK